MNLQSIAENFCNQLVALQLHIATREENPNLPSMQEVNMQVRLLNAIDKITRTIARQEKEAETATVKSAQASAPVKTTEVTLPPTPPRGDPQPFTDAVFEEYRTILRDHRYGSANTTIVVRNREVNRWWFMYNLYQYCQPTGTRNYIATNEAFHKTINLEQMHHNIASYLNQVKAA